MGVHTPPVYPLRGKVWFPPNTPAGGPPGLTNISFQLYISPYCTMVLQSFAINGWYPTTWIKTPAGITYPRNTIIQPDAGSNRYYIVAYREFFYLGFASGFEGLLVFQCTSAGAVPDTY